MNWEDVLNEVVKVLMMYHQVHIVVLPHPTPAPPPPPKKKKIKNKQPTLLANCKTHQHCQTRQPCY